MTKAEKAHLSAVAAIGCICCWLDDNPGTPAELHHIRAGVGKGQRADSWSVLPLCAPHHRGILHPQVPSIHLDRLNFIAQYGTEAELLERVKQLL